METQPNYLFLSLKLLGALSLLIYGMKVMSESLQKMAGEHLRNVLGRVTSNRFAGVLTGVMLTVAVQSSAATTVMTVSFVNAGLLTLLQAISVIMGANIGTTLSAWIMSAGFSFNISDLVWPAFFVGILLIYGRKQRYVGDLLFGVAFLLFALGMLSATGKEMDLAHNVALSNFFASFDSHSILTIVLFLLIGTVLTCMVQSSAAMMAITMVLCSGGVLTIYQGIALVMGENIGTTLTANLTALTGNVQARRAAMAHLLFNVFGVLWVLAVFFPFVNLTCSFVGFDPTETTPSPARISFALAAFHTTFNITNMLLLIGFTPRIERLCCWIIKEKPEPEDKEFSLKYLESGVMKTPEISVLQAQKEIIVFTERARRMFTLVRELLVEKDGKKFEEQFAHIEKYEKVCDKMEYEIARYLADVSQAHISDDTKAAIRRMTREVGELESTGDACYNIARTLRRNREANRQFTEDQFKNLFRMMELADESLVNMNTVMRARHTEGLLQQTLNIEFRINALRDELRERNIDDVNQQCYTYDVGSSYVDIVNECEKLGDYVLNVVQARLK